MIYVAFPNISGFYANVNVAHFLTEAEILGKKQPNKTEVPRQRTTPSVQFTLSFMCICSELYVIYHAVDVASFRKSERNLGMNLGSVSDC